MGPVVTPGDGWEVVNDPLSWLLLSWVITASCGFWLGVVCVRCCRCPQRKADLQQSKWGSLVRKAVTFVNRRRRVALAFNSYKNSTLRNTETSKPSQARRAAKARTQTPSTGRILYEGPALTRRRDGPNGR